MAKKRHKLQFLEAGIGFQPKPDARIRERPETRTLEALIKRFSEKPSNHQKNRKAPSPRHSHK